MPKPNNKDSLRNQFWRTVLTMLGTKQFFHLVNPWIKPLFTIALSLLAFSSIWCLAFAPEDYLQGNSYRIIFVHVPAASIALSIYLTMALLSISFLVWRIKISSLIAEALAPIGFLMCILSLVTGSIWAKPTWGTYWVWDARLTSMLILAFLYAGVIALYAAFTNSLNRRKSASILSIIGSVNLPIIKYSVEWWNTLHQGATFSIKSAPKMSVEMWLPLLFMMISLYLLIFTLTLYRTNTLILKDDFRKNWVKQWLRQQRKEN